MNDDLRFYLGVARRRYPYFALAFILVFLAAAAVAFLLPPIFRSEAKVLVESQQIPEDLVRSTVTSLAEERIQVIKQRILARDFLTALADKFQLKSGKLGKLTPTQLVEDLRSRIFIDPFNLGLTGRRSPTGSVSIAFTVAFEDQSPSVASQVANELVTSILNEDVRSRTSRASETTEFLNRESTRLQSELAKLEREISRFKQANKNALPERIPFHMAALERAEKSLSELDRELSSLNETRRMLVLELSVRNASVDGSPSDDPTRQLELLEAELSQKLAIYSESHPDIKSLRRQIKALKESIPVAPTGAVEDEASSTRDLSARIVTEKIAALDEQRELMTKQRSTLTQSVTSLNNILAQAPEVQNAVAIMDRRHENLRKDLDEISGKLSQAKMGEQLEQDRQAERFEIIEQPVTPQEPIKPNRRKILFLGFALALAAGVGSVFSLELVNRSIRTTGDLFSATGKHALVTIPYIVNRPERRRRFWRIMVLVWILVAALTAGAFAVHIFLMPLDLLAIKLVRDLGFQ